MQRLSRANIKVGVVHVVGVPSTTAQNSGALIHHTLGTGDFTVLLSYFPLIQVFQDMARSISATQAILNDPSIAAAQVSHLPSYLTPD